MAQLALAQLALPCGCVTVVEAPVASAEPVVVLLVNEACHKGLVLPGANGAQVEWGFGDFAWYALERNRWYHAFATTLWPTRGTLSRRVWGTEERTLRAPADVVELRADRARVAALAARLQAEFDRAAAEVVWNEHYQTKFAPSECDYWLFHDCHDATAAWLAELGCRVEFGLVRLDLSFRERTEPARASDD